MLVVTHGGVLGAIYTMAHGHHRGAIVDNCSIGELLVEGYSFAVLSWNDTSHLNTHSNSSGFGGGAFG